MDIINKLDSNQVFVFGSNLAGRHMGGAARQARKYFGAQDGVGEGLTGQCYAFPTLNADFTQRTQAELEASVALFVAVAEANPGSEYLLTRVGCGFGGYTEDAMEALFANMPTNVVQPDWHAEPTKPAGDPLLNNLAAAVTLAVASPVADPDEDEDEEDDADDAAPQPNVTDKAEDVLKELTDCTVCFTSDSAFANSFQRAANFLDLTDQQMADGLLVSRRTINRWRNGVNLPHVALRRSMLNWLATQVMECA